MNDAVTSVIITDTRWQLYLLHAFPALERAKFISPPEESKIDQLARKLPVNLKQLNLKLLPSINIAELRGLKNLEKLVLPVFCQVSNIHLLKKLPKLTDVIPGNSTAQPDVSFLTGLPHLRTLTLTDDEVYLSPIGQLERIETLDISDLTVDGIAPFLPIAPKLMVLNASLLQFLPWTVSADNITDFVSSFKNLEELNMKESHLVTDSLEPFANLTKLTQLEMLTVKAKPGTDWSPVGNLTKLTFINQCANCVTNDFATARVLEKLPLLQEIVNPVAISARCKMPQVGSLTLYADNKRFKDVVPELSAECFPNLEWLWLNGCIDTTQMDLTGFKRMHQLIVAQLTTTQFAGNVRDWSWLSKLTQINYLALPQLITATDYSFLHPLVKMKELNLKCQPISDLSVVSEMKYLRRLILSSTLVSDLSPLKNLRHLHTVSLNNSKVTDPSSLCELPELTNVYMHGETDCAPIVNARGKTLPSIKRLTHQPHDCLFSDSCPYRSKKKSAATKRRARRVRAKLL